MRSLSIQQTTLTTVPEREEREQRDRRCSSLRCMGTDLDNNIWGCRYYVMFINDFSRHTWIYPMRQKSEVFRYFKKFKNEVEKATGRHVCYLRSDGGKEYLLDEFTTYLRKEGICQEFSCQHTPQQNGVAERKNRHILEVVRAIMNEKNLPKLYWVEAANTIVYLMNWCTTSGVHDITPH